jgi:hypothetical protein
MIYKGFFMPMNAGKLFMKLLVLMILLPVGAGLAYTASWMVFANFPEAYRLAGTITSVLITDLIILFVIIAGQIKVLNQIYEMKEEKPANPAAKPEKPKTQEPQPARKTKAKNKNA